MLFEYASQYKGRRVGFVGLGVSNLPILELFLAAGALCTVRDKKDISGNGDFCVFRDRGAEFICGDGYLDGIREELLFLSPAVRSDLPPLLEAKKRGTRITCEMEEFFSLCPCKKIAVTGSDGKTTTTTLIALLLEKAGHRVHLGGNIGVNLLSKLDSIQKEDFAVVELSSFQLMKMTQSPHVSVVTNISPNHLDWHRDMAEYIAAKKNIFYNQTSDGVLVLNLDDDTSRSFSAEAKCAVRNISGKTMADVWFDAEGIHCGDRLLVSDGDIKLVGVHNRYNYCQAYCAVMDHVSVQDLYDVATTFGGVEHRIEFVREKDGVKYYNSSIDSSPSRTRACLMSFEKKVVVISGGYDKQIPYDSMGELFFKKVKYAVLMGATAKKIASALDSAGFSDYCFATDMDDAVKKASEMAQPGDTVVLSPASASFDMYKNFAQRGEIFKQIVNGL